MVEPEALNTKTKPPKSHNPLSQGCGFGMFRGLDPRGSFEFLSVSAHMAEVLEKQWEKMCTEIINARSNDRA